jgi:hypothetical protein
MTTTEARYIAKCANGHVTQAIGFQSLRVGVWIDCPCGSAGVGRLMTITINPEKGCNGICMGAKGPSCDCSCGGENHGSNHAA